MPGGWGWVSYWPADRIKAGDWTPAIWRSPELAETAARFSNAKRGLISISESPDVSPYMTGSALILQFQKTDSYDPGRFPILKSRGADAQTTIQSTPDQFWIHKQRKETETEKILQKAGYLLITDGQNAGTARLTAVASNEKYVGIGWLPFTGSSPQQAKAIAVFINSTPGRIQLMRNAGRTLAFPLYRQAGIGNIRIPDTRDTRTIQELADCWERTKDMVVPQFRDRDDECEVRRLWDDAVADAMGWDADELTSLRSLLHQEPHVSGVWYKYARDEVGG